MINQLLIIFECFFIFKIKKIVNKNCNTCKQKGFKPGQIGLLILSFYILGSAIYGTIKLFQLIFS
jgi:hypothetical protein